MFHEEMSRLRGNNYHKSCKNIVFNTIKNIWFGYLLESPQCGDSKIYPKHMLHEEIRTKQDLSYISIYSLSILYNSKFVLMAKSLRRNAGFVTRIHCKLKTQRLMKF